MAPIFSASLISAEVASSFPDTFVVRPLEKDDYAKGFLECLRDLTWMGNVTLDEFNERYDELDTNGKGPYYYLVIEHGSRIVGTGLVFVEKKFIHNRCSVGHIEEICISKKHQGRGLGLKMISALDSVAKNLGCRKNILNCSPEKEGFYKRCGYESSGMEMAHEFTSQPDGQD